MAGVIHLVIGDTLPCPVSDCRNSMPAAKLMCPGHWRMLQPGYQGAVYAAYDHGAGLGTEALRHAQEAAIAAVERSLARKS